MDENELFQVLKAKISDLKDYAWKINLEWPEIESWLDNFDENERIHMLYLLSQFLYFGNQEMRETLKSIYRDKYKYSQIAAIRKENEDTTDLSKIKILYDEILEGTRFLGVGNPSESGTHLLYYFRQENNLEKKLFINSHEVIEFKDNKLSLKNPYIKQYVFIDDLCGGGTQACRYSRDIVDQIKNINKEVIVSYYVLFATEKGLKKVKSESSFDVVDAIFIIDDSFKCFNNEARQFNNSPNLISKEITKNICTKYGESLYPDHPLGFNDCQLLLGFAHNTPNNTLPIIWSDGNESNNWFSIFKRYRKNYGMYES